MAFAVDPGHEPWWPLVTTAIAGGIVLAATGSIPMTVGIAVGGFLIDLDHVADYVIVETLCVLS
jgi:hypothetical protein